MADEPKNPLRTVGSALEGLAKRVGALVAEVSETVTLSEANRKLLTAAREHRAEGRPQQALETLAGVEGIDALEDAVLQGSVCLSLAHLALLGQVPPEPEWLADRPKGDSRIGTHELAVAAILLSQDKADKALDELRRAFRGTAKVAVQERDEFTFLAHLVGLQGYAALGDRERAIREAHKARSSALDTADSRLLRIVRTSGFGLLLEDDQLVEAEHWLTSSREVSGNTATTAAEPDELEAACLARLAAVRGDQIGARSLLERAESGRMGPVGAEVALLVESPERAQADALAYLQQDASDPKRLRLWALAQARSWTGEGIHNTDGVFEALLAAARAAPKSLVGAHAAELAHISLRASDFSRADAILNLAKQHEALGRELSLLRIRRALETGERRTVEGEFAPGPPVSLRLTDDLGTAHGPDHLSPLRNAGLRERVVAAHRAVAVAQFVREDDPGAAADALVEALIEDPELPAARAAMQTLSEPLEEKSLETLLTVATETLAAAPARVLGVPLELGGSLSQVIGARERLARPLTIAIMGEFSSGKSSFVNALLGESVAPTGVLPTTSTINVFRRGRTGGARVHYRDGSIETLARDQVEPFLHGLDDVAAGRIRYVEIERGGDRMGETAVVDTPGLNALDPYHEKVAREFLDTADAVVWVFSATRGGSASEAAMLGELRASGRRVLGILNKVDILEGGEQDELIKYLQEQLGEVLAEVVPLSAEAAIAFRQGEKSEGRDPFAHVDTALETHFLEQARELKRALTARRLGEALEAATAEVKLAIEALEARGEPDADQAELVRLCSSELRKLANALHDRILNLDDPITRGVRSLGLDTKERELSDEDTSYLDEQLRDQALGAIGAVLGEHRKDSSGRRGLDGLIGASARSLASERFAVWARGHLTALTSMGFSARLWSDARTHAESEAGLRAAIRQSLRSIAVPWRGELESLWRDLERTVLTTLRRRHFAPRAEALRLRTALLEPLRELSDALDTIE